jgi:hypothetical protein
MKCVRSLLFIYLMIAEAKAQAIRFPVYTTVPAYSNLQADAFSFAVNQAALASLHHFTAGVYAERLFFLKDMTHYCASVALVTPGGNFGFNGAYFGNPDFSEASIGLAYARRLGKIDIGVQFNYTRLNIAAYGRASSVNVEGGFLLHFTSKLNGGMHVYNPTRSELGSYEEKLPVIVAGGFGYDLSPVFFIGAAFEKEESLPVSIRVGFHYAVHKKIFLRAGISSTGSLFFFGLGYIMGQFRIDATAAVHPQLGTTPGLLFLYNQQEE